MLDGRGVGVTSAQLQTNNTASKLMYVSTCYLAVTTRGRPVRPPRTARYGPSSDTVQSSLLWPIVYTEARWHVGFGAGVQAMPAPGPAVRSNASTAASGVSAWASHGAPLAIPCETCSMSMLIYVRYTYILCDRLQIMHILGKHVLFRM